MSVICPASDVVPDTAGVVNKPDAPRVGGRILDVDGVMKPGSNGKGRIRGRNNQPQSQIYKGRGPSRNQVYDSNGPGVRVRGNAHQVVEKYQALARDAAALGDRLLCENYLQHAEHYLRIILAINQNNPQRVVTRLDQGQALDGPDDFYEDGEELQEATVEAIGLASGSVAAQGTSADGVEASVVSSGDEVGGDRSRPRRPREGDPRERPDRRGGEFRARHDGERSFRGRDVFVAPVGSDTPQPFVVMPEETVQVEVERVAPVSVPRPDGVTADNTPVEAVVSTGPDPLAPEVRKPRRRRAPQATGEAGSIPTEQAEV